MAFCFWTVAEAFDFGSTIAVPGFCDDPFAFGTSNASAGLGFGASAVVPYYTTAPELGSVPASAIFGLPGGGKGGGRTGWEWEVVTIPTRWD